MVASIDHLASGAGVAMLRMGGSAVDAAIAANAVLAVTNPHQCGPGGDLFAIVHPDGETPRVLSSVGRAGSGANAAGLRAEGHRVMPFKRHIASVPIPGCVDGWLTLHHAYGRLPFADVLEPAIRTAEHGFGIAPHLAPSLRGVADVPGAAELMADGHPALAGALVRRPGLARTLRAIISQGRDGFYGGEFGEALIELGAGQFTPEDLETPSAEWGDPVSRTVWGHRIWTVPPVSQGYLTLLSSAIAEGLDLPEDPTDGRWVHLLVEAARAAAHDRLDRLHEHAEATALVADQEVDTRRQAIDPDHRIRWSGHDPAAAGDTIYLCAVDSDRMGVSLIQSNAAAFGSELVAGATGIFLHNRGNGFSLVAGHRAEYGPGRRPPHTLAPATVSRPDGSLHTVLGTMGGDSQPQILLQLLVRLLRDRATPNDAIAAPRFVLAPPDPNGFDTWTAPDEARVMLEDHAPDAWFVGLQRRGHPVERTSRWNYGHANLIHVGALLEGAAEPRVQTSDAAGW